MSEPFIPKDAVPSRHGLPHRGGRVRFADGTDTYANGKAIWRCSSCGAVGPWREGWGGWWSLLEEERTGLYADSTGGFPVWCSGACQQAVVASGACSEVQQPGRRRSR